MKIKELQTDKVDNSRMIVGLLVYSYVSHTSEFSFDGTNKFTTFRYMKMSGIYKIAQLDPVDVARPSGRS